jgi:hypothetical protein
MINNSKVHVDSRVSTVLSKKVLVSERNFSFKEKVIVTQIAILPEKGIHPSALCPGIDVRDKHRFILSSTNHIASQASTVNKLLKYSLKQTHTNTNKALKVKYFIISHYPCLLPFKRLI